MKKYLLLLAAGAMVLPGLAIADAHGYSQGVSGNVRINHLQTTDGDVTTSGTNKGGADTYLQWNHNYAPSDDKSVTGFIRFESNGDQRINVTGSASEGDWSTSAMGEWDQDGAGGVTDDNRDQYVQVTNANGASIFFGSADPFDSLKGNVLDYSGGLSGEDATYLSLGAVGYNAAAVDDLVDSHFNYIQLGYGMANGLSLALILQMDNTSNKSNILGYDISDSIGAGTYDYDISANAVMVDYSMGAIDAAFSTGSGSAETSTDRDTDEDGTKDPSQSYDLSLNKLGLNYDAGVAQVHVNYVSTSLETKDTGSVTIDYTGMNVGVSAAAGGGTVVFDLMNTSFQEDAGGNTTAEEEETGSATELGYLGSIGGASFKAIYGTGSYDDKVDGNNDDDSYLHLRLEYGF